MRAVVLDVLKLLRLHKANSNGSACGSHFNTSCDECGAAVGRPLIRIQFLSSPLLAPANLMWSDFYSVVIQVSVVIILAFQEIKSAPSSSEFHCALQPLGEEFSKCNPMAFSHRSLPTRPALSMSSTACIVMFVHGVYDVH